MNIVQEAVGKFVLTWKRRSHLCLFFNQ